MLLNKEADSTRLLSPIKSHYLAASFYMHFFIVKSYVITVNCDDHDYQEVFIGLLPWKQMYISAIMILIYVFLPVYQYFRTLIRFDFTLYLHH